MPGDLDGAPLRWRIACADADHAAPMGGYDETHVAPPEERAAIAAALELVACQALSVTVNVRSRAATQKGSRRYRVIGRIQADIEQACVATLDPIHTHIDTVFAGDFCPASDLADAGPPDAHVDPDAEDEPMAIADEQLDIGQLAFEHLVLAIDPFPRQPEAEAVEIERGPQGPVATGAAAASDGGGQRPNPFAVLARLKPDKE